MVDVVDDVLPAVEKVTVRLHGEALKDIRKQARELNISVNEYIRRALGTEKYLIDQKNSGHRVFIGDRDNNILREVVIR